MRNALRGRLKAASARVHEDAERSVDLHAELETAAGYQRFLAVMLDVHQEHHGALDQAASLAGLPPRSMQLSSDLATDLDLPEPAVFWTGARCEHTSNPWATGVGYALEGSALGAAVVRRRIPTGSSSRYLDSLLLVRRNRWTAFSRWLDEQTPSPAELDEMVLGTTAVFDSVRAALSQHVHEAVSA